MDLSRRRLFTRRTTQAESCRPPWSLQGEVFFDRCTRCDACLGACPTGLLRRGGDGFPVADFSAAACTLCGDCARACTPGALSRDGDPWLFMAVVGEACLAYRRVECRVCGDVCQVTDADAIHFHPVLGGVPRPEIDAAACTGCGACLAPCPTSAITRVSRRDEAPLPSPAEGAARARAKSVESLCDESA